MTVLRFKSSRRLLGLAVASALAGAGLPALAQKTAPAPAAKPLQGQVVKMVRIDPLSGLLGPVGISQRKGYEFFADKYSALNPAGVKFEMSFIDNKLSPTESLNALKSALDQGVRYIVQGNGSSVALALIDAINKHNERNPGKEVVYLNDSAVDPDLTNSKCSYWHFRFDADTSMKMEAMTTYMKEQADIKKVYLLNQNYSHGTQVVRYAKEGLSKKRPDVQIVGEDLHPLGQVRDFAPYIAKIKAAGADTVITGNWGSDLSLLIKAANEGGYTGKFYTYYTGVTGTVQSVAQASFDAWVKYYRPDENTANATVSYYTKGAMVALALDLTLRAEGKTNLDAVMRRLWTDSHGGPIGEDDILAALQSLAGRSLAREIQAWVHGTEDLPLLGLLHEHGVECTHEAPTAAQRLGARLSETAGVLKVQAVMRGGAAERAGLAAGDELLAFDRWRLRKPEDLALFGAHTRAGELLVSRDQRLRSLSLDATAKTPGAVTLSAPAKPGAQALRRRTRWLSAQDTATPGKTQSS